MIGEYPGDTCLEGRLNTSMDMFVYVERFVCEDQIYWDRHQKRNDQLVVGGRTGLLSAEVIKDKTD